MREEAEHRVWDWFARQGEDLRPSLWALEEDAQSAKSRYATGSCYDSSEAGERFIEGGQIAKDAAIMDGVAGGTHFRSWSRSFQRQLRDHCRS